MSKNSKKERIDKAIAYSDHILSLDEKKVSESLGSEELSIVSYKQFKLLTECNWYRVNQEVKYMPTDLMSEIISLRTIMDSRLKIARFGWHFHNCWEMVIARSGAIQAYENGPIIKKGGILIYPPNIKHNPLGVKGQLTNIDVFFSKKPFKNIEDAIIITE